MINIDELFDKDVTPSHTSLDSGNGILIDIKIWQDRYKAHLVNSGKSINTIDLYKRTLEPLSDFIERYFASLSGISMITTTLNAFLEWMEQYGINKLYGSQKERVTVLVEFIQGCNNLSVDNYYAQMDSFFRDLDDHLVDMAEYTIKDFYEFYRTYGGVISQDVIKAYIESRPKLLRSTMNQRRIALIAFLKFIDKSINSKHFGNDLWKIKNYKLTKTTNKIVTGLTDEEDESVSRYLRRETNEIVSSLMRVQPNSDYCEWRNRAMLLLMKKAGLRTSEALHLKFTDITLNKSGSSYVLKVLGKGNKERRVPINKKLFEPFLLYLTDNKRGVYLSSTSSGAPMKRSNLHAAIRKIFEVAGVERSGLHLLRHDYGSRFAAKNGNMKILQDLLGHAVITTTMIYSHVSDEVMANAVNQLDEKDINA
jgi:site-specific recombinase XerD